MLDITQVFIKLLNDPRTLEARSVAISKEEKETFVDLSAPAQPTAATETAATPETVVSATEEKETDKASAKKVWRPLGAPAAPAAASTGSGFAALTSPTVRRQMSMADGVVAPSPAHALDNKNNESKSSFLLRSPVVNSLLRTRSVLEVPLESK